MKRKYSATVTDNAGNVVSSATIAVYLATTGVVANIYLDADSDTHVHNTTSDGYGRYTFYVSSFDYDTDQTFRILISKTGKVTQTIDDITIEDNVLQSYTISADKTVSAYIRVPKGVTFAIASGKVLTFSGGFEAGLYQVFSGSGTVVFSTLKPNEIFPEWWGATSSSSDNQPYIQAALDCLKDSSGGNLTLSSLYTTDRLIVGGSNITVQGMGWHTGFQAKTTLSVTGLLGAGTSQSLVQCYPDDGVYTWAAGGSSISNVTFRNLLVQGVDTSGTYVATKGGIWTDAVNNVKILNCKVAKMRAESILISPATVNSEDALIEGCEVTGGGDGIHGNRVLGLKIINNYVHDNFYGWGIGSSGSSSVITGNVVDTIVSTGIDAGGSGLDGTVGGQIVISNNTVTNCGVYSLMLTDDTAETTRKVDYLVTNNVLSKAALYGVYFTLGNADSYVHFQGNIISDSLGDPLGIGVCWADADLATYYVLNNTVYPGYGNTTQTYGLYRSNACASVVYLGGNVITGHSVSNIREYALFKYIDNRYNTIGLADGVTAPSAISGITQIYVDVADGDLKVLFGDGFSAVLKADS